MKNGPYILLKAPPKYPGRLYRGSYAYEHHIVYWIERKKIPKKGQVIHHINGVKTDNRIENLELLTVKGHAKVHQRGALMVELMCFTCGKSFIREKRQVKYQRSFCSRSHQVTTQQRDRWEKV